MRVVKTMRLTVIEWFSFFPTAFMPSVSSKMRMKSSHSRAIVPIQIPFVQGLHLVLVLKASGISNIRERKNDLPVR